ncbi:hypothetical protein [Antricoccus suffuscus]|uniref:hypothetical protein n=1 Tax=Antricoccus suffuscus TaxID=1629062 RepID=UPI0011B22B60|nr:hypothetical protein [Antricoccus suffuscus]
MVKKEPDDAPPPDSITIRSGERLGRERRKHVVVQPESVSAVHARTPVAAIAALLAVIFVLCALGLSAVVHSDSNLLNALIAIVGGFGISVVGTFLIVNRLDTKWFDSKFQRASADGDLVLLPTDDDQTARLAYDAARLETPGAWPLIKQLREAVIEREKAEEVMQRAVSLGATPDEAAPEPHDLDSESHERQKESDVVVRSSHLDDAQESYRVARHLYDEAQQSIRNASEELEAHNLDAEAQLAKAQQNDDADAEDALEAGKSADLFEATEELKVILTKKYD